MNLGQQDVLRFRESVGSMDPFSKKVEKLVMVPSQLLLLIVFGGIGMLLGIISSYLDPRKYGRIVCL